MSAKREKKIRMFARQRYEVECFIWYRNKPSKWRIFRYLKWKKQKPIYSDIEKQIRKIAKAG